MQVKGVRFRVQGLGFKAEVQLRVQVPENWVP